MGSDGHGSAMCLGITFSCVPPYFFHIGQGYKELTTLFFPSRVLCQVPGIGDKARGVADGTRSRRVDVLVHGTYAYLRRQRLAAREYPMSIRRLKIPDGPHSR